MKTLKKIYKKSKQNLNADGMENEDDATDTSILGNVGDTDQEITQTIYETNRETVRNKTKLRHVKDTVLKN